MVLALIFGAALILFGLFLGYLVIFKYRAERKDLCESDQRSGDYWATIACIVGLICLGVGIFGPINVHQQKTYERKCHSANGTVVLGDCVEPLKPITIE